MRFASSVVSYFLMISSIQASTFDWSSLPWGDLTNQLSLSATLSRPDSSAQTFSIECVPEVYKPLGERSNLDLIDQPSGLCVDQMYCAFEGCNPIAHSNLSVKEYTNILTNSVNGTAPLILLGFESGTNLPTNQTQLDGWLEDDNPAWNLPSVVLHPVTAGDVVAAIKFAKDHDLEVSVKNSGHSYSGASTKKDTLHLNMNKYTHYAPTGIIECDSVDDTSSAFQSDLSDQPCRLAKARGMQGVLRVGGGENYDKSYRAVKAFNEIQKDQNGAYKYHLVGAGAGTVSPMGWTFQGGLPNFTGGRLWGLGVDQVIRIDAVLANGKHVRFGPTEWEDVDDFIYPKTTAVTGVCHQNPEEEDESKWEWSTCEDAVNFDDLWFAMRGGGGGTWGLVTSIILQLQDYLPYEIVNLEKCVPEILKPLINLEDFEVEFLLDPTSLGATEEESARCSGPFNCYGENSSQPVFSAWSTFVSRISQTLVDAGVNASTVNDLTLACSDKAASFPLDYLDTRMFSVGPHKGKMMDYPTASYVSQAANLNLLVPAKYYLENPDATTQFALYYMVFGPKSNAKYGSDQANALSVAHRNAGNMAVQKPLEYFDDAFYTNVFPKMFDTSDPTYFPGFVGSNHAGAHVRGPLKADWTKACPIEWTTAERDKNCISLQEAIWGTKRLQRLEKIKEEIDPSYMFDCNGCVGNNRIKATAEEAVKGSAEEADEGAATNGTAKIGASDLSSGAAEVASVLLSTALPLVVAASFLLLGF